MPADKRNTSGAYQGTRFLHIMERSLKTFVRKWENWTSNKCLDYKKRQTKRSAFSCNPGGGSDLCCVAQTHKALWLLCHHALTRHSQRHRCEFELFWSLVNHHLILLKYFEIKGANLLTPFIMTSLDKVRFIVSFRYPHLKGNAEFGVVRGVGNPDVFDRKD